jgi:hypothetical protein
MGNQEKICGAVPAPRCSVVGIAGRVAGTRKVSTSINGCNFSTDFTSARIRVPQFSPL